jgi:hypothetical protein
MISAPPRKNANGEAADRDELGDPGRRLLLEQLDRITSLRARPMLGQA